jgi:hypothetical protein
MSIVWIDSEQLHAWRIMLAMVDVHLPEFTGWKYPQKTGFCCASALVTSSWSKRDADISIEQWNMSEAVPPPTANRCGVGAHINPLMMRSKRIIDMEAMLTHSLLISFCRTALHQYSYVLMSAASVAEFASANGRSINAMPVELKLLVRQLWLEPIIYECLWSWLSIQAVPVLDAQMQPCIALVVRKKLSMFGGSTTIEDRWNQKMRQILLMGGEIYAMS